MLARLLWIAVALCVLGALPEASGGAGRARADAPRAASPSAR